MQRDGAVPVTRTIERELVAQGVGNIGSVLFGGDSLGLTSDPFEEEAGKLAVVGRNGAYRMLRYPDDGLRAGQDVRLVGVRRRRLERRRGAIPPIDDGHRP